jgi:disulfide bond formation protein DsbB
MNQASDALRETHATRRAVDSKIHSLVALGSALLGLLVAFGIWTRLQPIGQRLFVVALILYGVAIALGLLTYYPWVVLIPQTRAILEFQDIMDYDELENAVAESIVELVEENARKIRWKSFLLSLMVMLIVLASIILVVSIFA